MPDGRVAAISQKGLVTSASATGRPVAGGFLPFDLSPLPDGRLLCTSRSRNQVVVFDPKDGSEITRLPLDEAPTNCTFGGNRSVKSVRMPTCSCTGWISTGVRPPSINRVAAISLRTLRT